MLIWACVLIITFVLELLTTALVSIWFSFGALLALFCAFMGFGGMTMQIIVFILTSLITLILTKPYVNKKLLKNIEPTNVDALIGKRAVVVTEVSKLKISGSVQLEGKMWSAKSLYEEYIPAEVVVVVERIEGVTLIVTKYEESKEENKVCL